MMIIMLRLTSGLILSIALFVWGDWQLGIVSLLATKCYFLWAAASYTSPPLNAEPPPRPYTSPEEFRTRERMKKIEAIKERRKRTQQQRRHYRRVYIPAACATAVSAQSSDDALHPMGSGALSKVGTLMETDILTEEDALTHHGNVESVWVSAPPETYTDINPANGLPCFGGIDVEGNPYGTDSHMFDDAFSSCDDSFGSLGDSSGFSSFDDY